MSTFCVIFNDNEYEKDLSNKKIGLLRKFHFNLIVYKF